MFKNSVTGSEDSYFYSCHNRKLSRGHYHVGSFGLSKFIPPYLYFVPIMQTPHHPSDSPSSYLYHFPHAWKSFTWSPSSHYFSSFRTSSPISLTHYLHPFPSFKPISFSIISATSNSSPHHIYLSIFLLNLLYPSSSLHYMLPVSTASYLFHPHTHISHSFRYSKPLLLNPSCTIHITSPVPCSPSIA